MRALRADGTDIADDVIAQSAEGEDIVGPMTGSRALGTRWRRCARYRKDINNSSGILDTP